MFKIIVVKEFLSIMTGSLIFTHIFSNVCLRMLPIMDMFIHRYLEMESSGVAMPQQGLEKVLYKIGSLYRFHHQPITFLYQTLYCYPQLAPLRKRTLALIIVQV